MNRYFKFGLILVLLSPVLGCGLTYIYSAILATDNIVNDLRILYYIYDQVVVLVIGCIFMAKSSSIEEYIEKKKNKA